MQKDQQGNWRSLAAVPGTVTERGLIVYRFGAPLFYANANRFYEEIRALVDQAPEPVQWVVLDAGPITRIDYTAARYVRQLHDDLAQRGVRVAIAHVEPSLRADLDRHHLTEVIGPVQIFDTLHEALDAVHGER
jgi:sulfate permease, SulP family